VCTSSTRPASPYDGQVIYETDTDATKVWNGSAWVGATNAASLNGVGEWTDYTPTWTATTTNPTIGNGTIVGRYTQINKLVVVQFNIVFGSTTNKGSGQYKISIPVTAATTLSPYAVVGSGYLLDASAASVWTTAIIVPNSGTTTVGIKITGTSYGDVSDTNPFTFTNGDEINGILSYKAA
jgi:hypothetical protein